MGMVENLRNAVGVDNPKEEQPLLEKVDNEEIEKKKAETSPIRMKKSPYSRPISIEHIVYFLQLHNVKDVIIQKSSSGLIRIDFDSGKSYTTSYSRPSELTLGNWLSYINAIRK